MEKELVCICCPMGCHLKVNSETKSVTGNSCKRGEEYGLNEVINPVRVITTTVKVNSGETPLLPVKTNGAIPKSLNFKCMEILKKIEVKAPISIGQVIVKNILDTGIDVISCREIKISKIK